MSYSYSLTLNDDVSRLRLELGDTSPEPKRGVKSNGAYFEDEELTYFMAQEGSLMRALAAACETLARDWSRAASFSVGPHSEQVDSIAAKWDARAMVLRGQYGYGSAEVTGNTITLGTINLSISEPDDAGRW